MSIFPYLTGGLLFTNYGDEKDFFTIFLHKYLVY